MSFLTYNPEVDLKGLKRYQNADVQLDPVLGPQVSQNEI